MVIYVIYCHELAFYLIRVHGCTSPNSTPFLPHSNKNAHKNFFRSPRGVHLHPCTAWLSLCVSTPEFVFDCQHTSRQRSSSVARLAVLARILYQYRLISMKLVNMAVSEKEGIYSEAKFNSFNCLIRHYLENKIAL